MLCTTFLPSAAKGKGVSQHHETTSRLAEFIAGRAPGDLPEPVRREAVRAFVNIVGCTVGGSRHEAVDITWRALQPFAGVAQATLIGRAMRTDLLNATLINGLSASAYTYDDTHAEAIVHPSAPVSAAAFAMAEHRPVSGREFLHAFALGVETVCRLSKAISVPPARGSIAWSQTGITGGIGAAVTAGKLMQFDAAMLRRAIGIAASQAAGIRVMHGSMCTPMMPAQAAQVGLRAVLLAGAGLTSSDRSIEGRNGFAECFADAADLSLLMDGLGERFEILANTYKPYPCGIVIHPMIDGCLELKAEHEIDHRHIEQVRVVAGPAALALTDRPQPKGEFECQVSLQHWTAAALMRGKAGVAELADACIDDPDMVALRKRIVTEPDPGMASDSTRITLLLRDGRQLVKEVRHCIGSKGRPMTDRQIEDKFTALADGILPPGRVRALMERCWSIESADDAGSLVRALGG